ncbi:MAG TPA: hypothetical protein VM124_01405 [Candidatus Limnocylindrales bacterium]|nr:hypothetical protein [Candidatus Limnocylindrales bacterium]
MDAAAAKQTLDKIVGQIFGYQNPLSLDQAMQKFAFDVRLPQQVYDSTTNEPTWAQSTNPSKFITMENAHSRSGVDDWLIPKRPLNSLQDILAAWADTNFMATERQLESSNVSESDNIYNSQNVYRSLDINQSKNVLFSDAANNSEFVVACQRSNALSFCIRVEDSKQCSNSFNVIWSAKVANCLFVQDCYDLTDCMFCSHITSKQFCIANMQYEETEYRKLKELVVRWILTS